MDDPSKLMPWEKRDKGAGPERGRGTSRSHPFPGPSTRGPRPVHSPHMARTSDPISPTALRPTVTPPPADRDAYQATTLGTRRFEERALARGPEFFRNLPRKLSTSALGLGTYLGDCTEADDAAYSRVARAALSAGVNLFDTAINYRCQRSERA